MFDGDQAGGPLIDSRTLDGASMQDFLCDTRYGLRLLARSPAFTTVGVLSLRAPRLAQ